MGEYYLKCEPTNTKKNMKDVLKFVNNPIFNNSVFSKETLNTYFKILLVIVTFVGFMFWYLFREDEKIAMTAAAGAVVSLISFVLCILAFTTDLIT